MRSSSVKWLLGISISLVVISFNLICPCQASIGDKSTHYQQCLDHLLGTVCKNQTRILEMKSKQPILLWLTGWTCPDECRYKCMWATVNQFIQRELPIPQFHGKWPFLRFLGMQEPASAIFSIFNWISIFFMWKEFKRKVPSSAPTYYIWNGYALFGMNAWLWSTVFHTRDTHVTELLDYLGAMFAVLYSFFGLCNRLFSEKSKLMVYLSAFICLSVFIQHAHYLTFVNFDYDYHLKVSLVIGFVNSVGWLLWCAVRWNKQAYVWKCSVVVVLVNCLLALELLDFPPILWIFDAHSLWHLGTVPIPFLWFDFLIEDCLFMLQAPMHIKHMNHKNQ